MSFYRFPRMRNTNIFSIHIQHDQIDEEILEARKALNKWILPSSFEEESDARIAYGMELLDIIHAVETALRMRFTDEEVIMMKDMVIKKNRDRGYYEDGE